MLIAKAAEFDMFVNTNGNSTKVEPVELISAHEMSATPRTMRPSPATSSLGLDVLP